MENNKYSRPGQPFDMMIDMIQPKGSTEMQWVHIDRLWELLDMLSDNLGNECDEEIKKVFPCWRYKSKL